MNALNYIFEYNSPVGELVISSDGESITGLWRKDQKYYASTLSGQPIKKVHPVLKSASNWLDRYFNGENPKTNFPLSPNGSEFRQTVWRILLEIPYGEVITYGEIAKMIASKTGKEKMSAQAVGGAVGHNPISIIIPCHRVVGSNGNLTGYAGGIDMKVKLLKLEGLNMKSFFIPKKGTAL